MHRNNRKTTIIDDAISLGQMMAHKGIRKESDKSKSKSKSKSKGKGKANTSLPMAKTASVATANVPAPIQQTKNIATLYSSQDDQTRRPEASEPTSIDFASAPSGPMMPTNDDIEVNSRDIDAADLFRVFLEDVGLDPAEAETSIRIISLSSPGGNRILTASMNGHGQITLHDTGVPAYYSEYDVSQTVKHTAAYLERGQHGPGGDFDLDQGRVTGRGHDYDSKDGIKYQEYSKSRATFYNKYPTYPRMDYGVNIDLKVEKAWNEQEKWYNAFRMKYPGTRLSQWVCGCEKMANGGEDESEEE